MPLQFLYGLIGMLLVQVIYFCFVHKRNQPDQAVE